MCFSGICPHKGYSGDCNLSEEDMIVYHAEQELKESIEERSNEMPQNILHIDSTPNEKYPLRILQAYRRMGDYKWSSTSGEIDDDHILIRAMNDVQEKRNVLLDKAIEILSFELLGVS